MCEFCRWAAEPATPRTVSGQNEPKRVVISLDGMWQIAEGKMDQSPTTFDRTVPVPGLVRWPRRLSTRRGRRSPIAELPQKDPKRDAFWYRRTFTLDGPLPAVAS